MINEFTITNPGIHSSVTDYELRAMAGPLVEYRPNQTIALSGTDADVPALVGAGFLYVKSASQGKEFKVRYDDILGGAILGAMVLGAFFPVIHENATRAIELLLVA